MNSTFIIFGIIYNLTKFMFYSAILMMNPTCCKLTVFSGRKTGGGISTETYSEIGNLFHYQYANVY